MWTTVIAWWGGQTEGIKITVLAGAALVSAFLVAAIGYMIASDVKARGNGQVAIIAARARVATAMLVAVKTVYRSQVAHANLVWIPVAGGLRAINHLAVVGNERDWAVIAVSPGNGAGPSYLLKKDGQPSAVVSDANCELR